VHILLLSGYYHVCFKLQVLLWVYTCIYECSSSCGQCFIVIKVCGILWMLHDQYNCNRDLLHVSMSCARIFIWHLLHLWLIVMHECSDCYCDSCIMKIMWLMFVLYSFPWCLFGHPHSPIVKSCFFALYICCNIWRAKLSGFSCANNF